MTRKTTARASLTAAAAANTVIEAGEGASQLDGFTFTEADDE